MDESKYVYVGVKCEIAGQEHLVGSTITVQPGQLAELDAARTFFISKSDFDSLFGPEDACYLSPNFIGVWPVTFIEKLEKARDIVRARRQGA